MTGRLMLLKKAIEKQIAAGQELETVLAGYLLDDAEKQIIGEALTAETPTQEA